MVIFGEKRPISVAPLWHRVSWQSERGFPLYWFLREEERHTEGKARGIKKEREYYRAAMTGHSAGTFALPRVDIAGLRIFKLRFVVFP